MKKKIINNELQNCYLDYFYCIYLKDITIDPNTGNPIFANKSDQSTFLHEYIHFLQNVLTLNGIAKTENELIFQQELLANAANTKRRFLNLRNLPINVKEDISNPYFKLRDIFYLDKEREDEVTYFSTIKDIQTKTENIMGYNETTYYLFFKEVKKKKLKKIKAT